MKLQDKLEGGPYRKFYSQQNNIKESGNPFETPVGFQDFCGLYSRKCYSKFLKIKLYRCTAH